MINQIKVISTKEMIKTEGLAYARGHKEEDFMEQAGISVAGFVKDWIEEKKQKSIVTLLVGKGNNGGDAYVAGRKLLEQGFQVEAIHIYSLDQCGPLCLLQYKRFMEAGGKVSFVHELGGVFFPKEGIILDGLVGTGFKGKAEGALAEAICLANHSGLPILAIDIPSGLCGMTGKVETVAVKAEATIYLEFPKIGFFLDQGWDHVGDLLPGEFGLPKQFRDEAVGQAFLVEGCSLSIPLPAIRRCRSKYDAGYVLACAGSPSMMGAGALTSYASLKAGAGICRLFYSAAWEGGIPSIPPEVISQPIVDSVDPVFKEMRRACSLLIGPGLGRDKKTQGKISKILGKCTLPCVIDADALFFLAKHPSFLVPATAILTPHLGEMKRLFSEETLKQSLWSCCQAYVEEKNTIVLLKGAPNVLFSPFTLPQILPFGNPGMATAGSGDVLTGIIAALLAQGLERSDAAILGCFLHGLSGDIAVREKTHYCLTASDLITYLPHAFLHYQKAHTSIS